VGRAGALATQPEVLLLDEPLSNLDAGLREEMRIELKELHRTLGVTFVYVTHDRVEALSMSDRIVVMREGQIDQMGTPRQVFEEPISLAVARFMGHSNLLYGEINECREGVATIEIEGGWRIKAKAPPSMRGGRRAWLLIHNNAMVMRTNQGGATASMLGALRGRVDSIFYHGLHVETHIVLTTGDRLRAELPAPQGSQLRPGDVVNIEVIPAGTWVLNHDGE